MLRLVFALAVIGLGLVLVLRGLENTPTAVDEQAARSTPVGEAERVRALAESQQQLIERRSRETRE